MVILKSQNKINDFFMILAWLCRFKWNVGEIIKNIFETITSVY